jgi:hypothetical protein
MTKDQELATLHELVREQGKQIEALSARIEALTNPPRVRVEAAPRYENPFPDSTYRLMDQFSVPKHITDEMAKKIGDDVVRDVVADARRGR